MTKVFDAVALRELIVSKSINLPKITTAERDLVDANKGDIIHNSDTDKLNLAINDGIGAANWIEIGSAATAPGGSDTEVQFNDSNTFGGDSSFVWDKALKTLTVSGIGFGYSLSAAPLVDSGIDYNFDGMGADGCLFIGSSTGGGPISITKTGGPVFIPEIDGIKNIGVGMMDLTVDVGVVIYATIYFLDTDFADEAAWITFWETVVGVGNIVSVYFRKSIFTNNGAGNNYTWANPDSRVLVATFTDPPTLNVGPVAPSETVIGSGFIQTDRDLVSDKIYSGFYSYGAGETQIYIGGTGILGLQDNTDTPDGDAHVGLFYVKTDGLPYYMDTSMIEYCLTDPNDQGIFALLAGRSGGQLLYGGTAASENLIIDSTPNVAKGKIIFRSGINLVDDQYFFYGYNEGTGVPKGGIGWNTQQTEPSLIIGTPSGKNTVLLIESGDVGYDFGHAAQTNPTFFFHSAVRSQTEWSSITWNQLTFKGGSATIKTDGTSATDLTITCGTDKTLILTETVWEDMQFPLASGKVPAANYPTWELMTTSIEAYAFSVGDHIQLQGNEPPHGWKEGTVGSAHIHFTLKTAQTSGSNQFAKFELIFAYADVNGTWTEQAAITTEATIATGTAAKTHYLQTASTTVTLTGLHLGAQIKARVRRIAATGGTEYGDKVFITQVGVHIECDTLGSRSITSK